MEILAVQDLPEAVLSRDGMPAVFRWPQVIGGRAYFAASWTSFDTLQSWGSAAVATFDASVEEPLLTVLEDARCGVSSAVTPFVDAAGNVLVVGDWSSGLLQIGAVTPAPNPACLLRLSPDGAELDPAYYVDLLAAANARAIYDGHGMEGGRVLLQYWPAEEPGPTPQQIEADPYAYYAARVFRYGVLELATGDFVPVTAIPPGAAINDSPLSLDGITLVQAYPEGGASTGAGTDLLSIAGDGSVAKRLSAGIAGELAMIGRLRSAAR